MELKEQIEGILDYVVTNTKTIESANLILGIPLKDCLIGAIEQGLKNINEQENQKQRAG